MADILIKMIYQEENAKAVAEATARLEKVTDAEKALVKQNQEVGSSSEKAKGAFDKLKDGAATLAMGVAAAGAALVTLNKIAAMVTEGAQINRINDQWTNAAARMGENGQAIVDAVDKVTGRTIDDEEIMQAASRTLTQGLVENGAQVTEMFRIAQAMAVGFGGSAVQAFEAESMAIETGMTRQLKRQGIVVNFEAAYKKYAAAVGKTTDALTEDEQYEVRRNEILEKGAVLVNKIGDATNDQVSKIQRLERGWGDMTDAVKEYLATIAVDAMDAIDISDNANVRIADAFHATAAKMKQDMIDGKMSLEDFNNAIKGMGSHLQNSELEAGLVKSETLTQQMVNGFRQLKTNAEEAGAVFGKYLPDILAWANAIQGIKPIDKNTPTDLSKLAPDKLKEAEKEYGSYQDKLTGLETKHQADRKKVIDDTSAEINALRATWGEKRLEMIADFNEREAEYLSALGDRRIDILSSWAEDEQKITDSQNKDRMQLARQYGEETVRAEQDYQRKRERAAQDHGRRLSKLADDRDALGIMDEMDAYGVESQRAEEDYQTTAGRRGEDYAQQLADLNAAAEEQRQARTKEKDKQLAEADAQFAKEDAKRKTANDKTLKDLDDHATAEENKLKDAETKKLAQMDIDLAAEQSKTNDAWKQWRNEHDIFFAGERAAWDAYLKYMHDSLIASSGKELDNTHLPGKASGGSVYPYGVYTVGERGPETLIMGSRGGYVVPNQSQDFRGLQLGGGAMGGRSISINMGGLNIMQPNATPAQIQAIVHRELISVAEAVMR